MRQALLIIQTAFVMIVIAGVFRLCGYHNTNPIDFIGVTPSAVHRLANSLLLFGIALVLIEIHRVLRINGVSLQSSKTEDDTAETK